MSEALPERFGPYRLEELLGHEGMAEVYRAYDDWHRRHVVLKRLPVPAGETFWAQARRNAMVAAWRRAPHVVPVLDYGEIDGWLYLVMQLVEGTDLKRELAAGPLELRRAVDIVSQIARGLDVVHRRGVVHGDIKPANILLDAAGTAYLTGFGIPRAYALDATAPTTGEPVDTSDYAAPERLMRADSDVWPASDVYALACVLFECLTGRVPFPAADSAGKRAAQLGDPLPAPSLFDSRIPPALDHLVRAGMDKDPRRRPTADMLMAAVERIVSKRYGRHWRRPPAEEPARDPGEAGPTADLHRSDLRLEAANEQRLAALSAGDEQLARSALVAVADELDGVLDSVAERLRHDDIRRDRKRIKWVVTHDLAASTAAMLPLEDVADLLDLPRDHVQAALHVLRTKGAPDPTVRAHALAELHNLQAQLRTAKATNDHALLDILIPRVTKLIQALVIAMAATVTATLAVGEQLTDTIVVKAAIIALVTMALHETAASIRDRRAASNPYTVTRDALADLIAELAHLTSTSNTKPAYPRQIPVSQIRILAKTYKVQKALINVRWKDKATCWNILGELAVHLNSSPRIDEDELKTLLYKLRAITIPASREGPSISSPKAPKR